MYDLPYFKEPDHQRIIYFLYENPFAMLIGCSQNRAVATQVPLLIEIREDVIFLKGHIMRNTDHHKALEQNKEVLCVFTGADAYVSASWYTQPNIASTWNYISVQARGILTFLNEEGLIQILKQTTDQFEKGNQSPASFEALPKEYVQRLAKAIIGFEIQVTSLEHVFKLSQNRDGESYKNIISNLSQGTAGAKTIAIEMEKRSDALFSNRDSSNTTV